MKVFLATKDMAVSRLRGFVVRVAWKFWICWRSTADLCGDLIVVGDQGHTGATRAVALSNG